MSFKKLRIMITVTAGIILASILIISLCDGAHGEKANIYPEVQDVELLEATWHQAEAETETVEEVADPDPVEETTDEQNYSSANTEYSSTNNENPEWWAQQGESGYYSPSDLQSYGVIYWSGWRWTYYSQKVMPGDGLNIPGRHVDEYGFVCDGDGYICLGTSDLDVPRYTVIDTLFGRQGKIYDYGYAPEHDIDVYTDW